MIISKKCLSRRTVLRGAGVAVALPLLDAMVPALVAQGRTAARPTRRLGIIYQSNGIEMGRWTPATLGADFELTPILEPLAPFRDRLTIVSGLNNKEAETRPGEGAGDHSRGPAAFLTGVHPKKTQGSDVQAGVSMDQIVARELGNETQLASLELAIESAEVFGSCGDPGWTCMYTSTVSWRTPTNPLPMENDPRAIFERLFGASGSTDSLSRRLELQRKRSLLDLVTGQVADLKRGLGATDTAKLTEYLDAVRDVERRIQRSEEQVDQELPAVERPPAIPSRYDEHAALIFDLLLLAYQCDLTRVGSLMMSRELTGRPYPEIGVSDGHHGISHHQKQPEQLAKLGKINTFHMTLFARFLEGLRSTPDGDGTLLDHTTFMYGAGISDGDKHSHDNLPMLLIGGQAGTGGGHIRVDPTTPLSNLHLAVMEKMGVAMEQFGDSSGKLPVLSYL